MRKLQVLTIVASMFLVSSAFAEPKNPTATGPSSPSGIPALTYNPLDGYSTVNVGNPANPTITTWEMQSTGGMINCDALNGGILAGLFDSCSANKLFVLRPDGQAEFDLGPIFPAGMSGDALAADLQIDGSILGGGGLDANDAAAPYLSAVPEPSSLSLLGLGGLGLLSLRRKRK